MLGLRCCAGFSPVAVSRGSSLAVVCRLLLAVASRVKHWLWCIQASVVAAHRLRSFNARALDRGCKDSVAPRHVGSSCIRD